jgi:hypothetical protein
VPTGCISRLLDHALIAKRRQALSAIPEWIPRQDEGGKLNVR